MHYKPAKEELVLKLSSFAQSIPFYVYNALVTTFVVANIPYKDIEGSVYRAASTFFNFLYEGFIAYTRQPADQPQQVTLSTNINNNMSNMASYGAAITVGAAVACGTYCAINMARNKYTGRYANKIEHDRLDTAHKSV